MVAPRKAKVLLVDDKPANLLALEAVLGDEYELVRAYSGAEVLAFLEKDPAVDLILMDVQMPDMDGFDTAMRIKSVPAWRGIPIIFITAIFTEDPYIRKGYEVGGIDYFSKPFDPEVLRMKVAVYASFHRKDALLKEREQHLRESEELLRVGRKLGAMLESLPVGVLIADAEGRVCQTTDQAAQILGCESPVQMERYGEVLGWWAWGGRRLKDPSGPLGRAVREGAATHAERIEVRCLDGSAKSVLASALPLRGADGQVVGAVVLIHDLSPAHRIQADLEERVAKLVSLGVQLEETAGPAS